MKTHVAWMVVVVHEGERRYVCEQRGRLIIVERQFAARWTEALAKAVAEGLRTRPELSARAVKVTTTVHPMVSADIVDVSGIVPLADVGVYRNGAFQP